MVDSPGPNPRCLGGLSPPTLLKLKQILEREKGSDTELAEALQRLIDMAEEEIDLSDGDEDDTK